MTRLNAPLTRRPQQRRALGAIDLDPASSEVAQRTVQAATFYVLSDDGLSKPWAGRVWLNPPYSQPAIQRFIDKLCQSYAADEVASAVLLTHNYTDTAWFHLALSCASAFCFTRGRIRFLDPQGKQASPTQGQVFFYFGADTDGFARVFERFGSVIVPSFDDGEEAPDLAGGVGAIQCPPSPVPSLGLCSH